MKLKWSEQERGEWIDEAEESGDCVLAALSYTQLHLHTTTTQRAMHLASYLSFSSAVLASVTALLAAVTPGVNGALVIPQAFFGAPSSDAHTGSESEGARVDFTLGVMSR